VRSGSIEDPRGEEKAFMPKKFYRVRALWRLAQRQQSDKVPIMLSKLHKELAEGLVAVVVIGVLLRHMVNIEILEPRRQKEAKYTCLSNLQQIGVAMLQYAQDNNDTLPRAATPNGKENWMKALLPYVHQSMLFKCPANESGGYSYVFNDAYASNPNGGLTSPSGQSLNSIKKLAQTILIADGTGDFRLHWELKDGAHPNYVDNHLEIGSVFGRHYEPLGQVWMPNTLFCDGHVMCDAYMRTFSPQTKGQDHYFAGLSIKDD